MTETLSSHFQKSNGQSIEINGKMVQPIFKTNINDKKIECRIKRLKTKDFPIQGLRIKAVKGSIEINGQNCSEIILWADTSPEVVQFSVISKAGCELKIWNVWRSDEITQAWIGNAGIIIDKDSGTTILECSCGVGDIDFSDLVVQIDFDKN